MLGWKSGVTWIFVFFRVWKTMSAYFWVPGVLADPSSTVEYDEGERQRPILRRRVRLRLWRTSPRHRPVMSLGRMGRRKWSSPRICDEGVNSVGGVSLEKSPVTCGDGFLLAEPSSMPIIASTRSPRIQVLDWQTLTRPSNLLAVEFIVKRFRQSQLPGNWGARWKFDSPSLGFLDLELAGWLSWPTVLWEGTRQHL